MLKAHFLNVGHGECTVIEHPSGRLTMVDINNSQEYDAASIAEYSAERRRPRLIGPNEALVRALEALQLREESKKELCDPVEFMKTRYPNRRIWRFILTHPDLDHMRGIKRLFDEVPVDCFWDTAHTKPTPSFRSEGDKADWEFYQALRRNQITRTYSRGDRLYAFGKDEYGVDGGDNIEILSPSPTLVNWCNQMGVSNDLSYVVRVSHAGRRIMLTGDIEDAAWNELIATYGANLRADFLSASHHGRDSGFHLNALKFIKPHVVVVSVGRKPSTDASNKYCGQCEYVVSTRYHGNIEIAIWDDGSCTWDFERNKQVA